MALEVIQDTVLVGTTSVAIAGGATVTIRNADTAALVTLFQDRLGAVGETNPFNADSGGQFRVYTASERLQITVVDGANSRVWEDFRLGDSILKRPLLLADFHFTATIDDPAAGDITVDLKQGDGATNPDVAHPIIVGFGSQQGGLEITAAAEVKLDKTDHLGLDDLAVNTEVTIYVYAIDRNGIMQFGLSRRPDYTRATAEFVNAEGTATDRNKVFCNAAITVNDLCRVVGFFKATYNTTTPDWDSVTSASIVIGPPPNAEASSASVENLAINGGCIVNQRLTAITLGGGNVGIANRAYGPVDRIAGFTTIAASAGTYDQSAAAPIGDTGFSAIFSGVTLAAGGKLHWLYRMEAKDAVKLKGGKVSISALIQHDIGSAKTATIIVRDPDVADVFSATSAIGNDGGTSILDATATAIEFEGLDLSAHNPERGLEIEIELDTGAITTKTAHLTELKIELGNESTEFVYIDHGSELLRCQRYYEVFGPFVSLRFMVTYNAATTSTQGVLEYVDKRAAPTITPSTAGAPSDFQVSQTSGAAQDVTVLVGNLITTKRCRIVATVAANLVVSEASLLYDDTNGLAKIEVIAEL